MDQNTSDGRSQPEGHKQAFEPNRLPWIQHNPVTQQMLIVAKRRETAEALLAKRLGESGTTRI